MSRELKEVIGAIIIVVVMVFIFRGCGNTDKEKVTVYEHLEDSTNYFKNKLKETVAENIVLATQNINTFLDIKSKDNLIVSLQARVKQYKNQLKEGGSVVDFGTSTLVDKTVATIVDSLPINDSLSCEPKYSASFRDKWIQYEIHSSKDSTKLKLMTEDNYSVIVGEEKQGLFKKKKDFADVISSSPYARVKQVRSYEVKDTRKPSRLSIGIQGGYGITLHGFSPFIGVGAQFNILKIR